MIRVGLLGFGYWGPNLLRNLLNNPNFDLVAVSDINVERLNMVTNANPKIKITQNAEDLICDPNIDAIVIATPVGTHFQFALMALNNGKHVLVEKPLCPSSMECVELISVAKMKNLTLMVDHTFIWNRAVQKIRELCLNNELGKICSFESIRVNLGLFQQDINVLWDLGPHDFSILHYLFNEDPIHIEATGYSHLNSHFPDVVYLTMYFASDIIAHLNMSWMSPVKVRRVSIGGTNKMLVWDDLNREETIKIYNSGISYQTQKYRNVIIPDYRIGDIFSPRISNIEALQSVVEHFAQVIMKKEPSLMDGHAGLRVVKLLENTQESLDRTMKLVAKKREQLCEVVY